MTSMRRAAGLLTASGFGAGIVYLAWQPRDLAWERSQQRSACVADANSAAALSALEKTGFCIVRGLLDEAATRELRGVLHGPQSALPEPRESSEGRWHFDMRGNPAAPTLESCVSSLRPLVKSFVGTPAAECTQLQLLDSAPGAQSQFFHCDNTARGVTILVPFSPGGIPLALGPTEILLGTNAVHRGDGAGADARSMLASFGRPLRTTLETGDALVFDSRLWHRGLANSMDMHREVLIVRYDPPEYPPPGVGILGTMAIRVAGSLLADLRDVVSAASNLVGGRT